MPVILVLFIFLQTPRYANYQEHTLRPYKGQLHF